MKNECIINCGISGSGKSTWAVDFIKKNHNYIRISRDDIRKVLVGDLHGYYNREDFQQLENSVTRLENQIFFEAVRNNKNIIIDNTNLKREYIVRWKEMCDKEHYRFYFNLFDCNLLEAQQRIMIRDFSFDLDWDKDTYLKQIQECNQVKYMEKQYQQYKDIKTWIKEHYINKII